VLYAGLCKALLFRDLEYTGSDLFCFLEMSWSWHYAGRLLHDNVYGDHYAIHNFFLLPALSPLTIPLGAYGFILGLVLLHLIAVLRAATAAALDLKGRLAVLAGCLCPVAFYTFDHPEWGFHPELCYPPLALLMALDLLDGNPKRAILAASLIVLVKEDGAVLCAAVLLACLAHRFWSLRAASREERAKTVRAGLLSLLALVLVFALGMLAHAAASSTDGSLAPRVVQSLRILVHTLAGNGPLGRRERLLEGLTVYALVGVSILLPLGRGLMRGLLLLMLSAPPLVIVLMVSSGVYRFHFMPWPPRIATLLAVFLACLACAAAASSGAAPRAAPSPAGLRLARGPAGVVVLAAISWGLQLLLLDRLDYSPWPRLDAGRLLAGRGYRVSTLSEQEVRFLRCLAGRLPGGLPVSSFGDTHPVFHRQSIVFAAFEARAWHEPRLRVVPSSGAAASRNTTLCAGPAVGGFAVQVECDLLPMVASCGGGG